MRIHFLDNLAQTKTRFLDLAPTDTPADLPHPALADKAAYRAWCSDSSTEHVFYSLVEGLTPGLRVSAANEPYKVHGLIGEFDALPPGAGGEWRGLLAANSVEGLLPTWASVSFSGHVRLIWGFQEPVLAAGKAFLGEFYKAAWGAIRPKRLLPGWEEKESSSAALYFELGRGWTCVGGLVAPFTVEGWQARAVEKVNWNKEGTALPIEAIRAEGERRWPGAWPGGWAGFDLGARGCRFWEGGDAMSVIVTPVGLKCFTGDKPFLFWADLFGPEFVRRLSEDTVGKAVEGIYYCPPQSKYYTNSTVCGLQPFGKEDIKLRLISAGLMPGAGRGKVMSDLDAGILVIQNRHTVEGVFPAMYRPEGVVDIRGHRFLNNSRVRLTPPVEGSAAWGEGFEFIGKHLPRIYREQLDYYLAWLAYFYQSCLAGDPQRGLALFIAGPSGVGKTWLQNAVHAQLFGDAAEATAYLAGRDQFNAKMFGCPIWTVDDAICNKGQDEREQFSEAVKAVTANDEFTLRGMYQEGLKMPWKGRLVVTMNDDAKSIQMLPSTEGTVLDKVLLLRAYEFEGDHLCPTNPETLGELPFFAAWLRDFKIPKGLRSGRFGTATWHHPELIQVAQDSLDSSSGEELIAGWAKEYFGADENKGKTQWTGTPTDLLIEMCRDEARAAMVARTWPKASVLGKHLALLETRGVKWITRGRTMTQRQVTVRHPPE